MNGMNRSSIAQRGAALFVSLIFLILITLLGVAGVQTVSLEEKMAGNSYDRNLAFQAAEAGLREAEKYVEDNKPISTYVDADNTCPNNAINNCNNNGICPLPDKDCTSRWEQAANFTGWVSANTNLGSLAGTAPQYFVEYLGSNFNCTDGGGSDPKNCKRYRVTACSIPDRDVQDTEWCRPASGSGRATVMLQSIYATN